MAGDFEDRIAELAERVGRGALTGSVEVNQIYAHYQHNSLDLRHPRGGQPLFLEQPLYDKAREYVQHLADGVLEGELTAAMADNMEDLSGQVAEKAPIEFGNLRQSGHPTVTDEGRTVYDRPPVQRRLTEDELRQLARLRGNFMTRRPNT